MVIKEKRAHQVHKKGRRHTREFADLSRLLMSDALTPQEIADSHSCAWDPATIHLFLDAKATEWDTAPALFAYRIDNKKDRFTREAYKTQYRITLQPLFLTFGKVYPSLALPHRTLLQNPLSPVVGDLYNLDEIVGLGSSIFGTHSDVNNLQKTTSRATRKTSGSPFAYSYRTDTMSLIAGVSWINDIADSNGFSKILEETGLEDTSSAVAGLNLNLGARYRAFTLTGGYLRTLDNFTPAPLSFERSETEPSAWNGELAYNTELLRRAMVLAVGYQKSSDSLKSYLPERRYITKASMALFDSTTLSLEYHIDKDFAVEDGGENEGGYGVTTKIGFGF